MSSLRSNIRGTGGNIAPELRDTLYRNGMKAEIVKSADGCQLVVQSHDSPAYTYNLSEKQYYALCDGGTNSSNRLAYNTFVKIVKDNFDCPKDWIHARNANGCVTMGLHGYRQDVGYGYVRPAYLRPVRGGFFSMFHPDFLGWTPRQQQGYHGRRIGSAYYLAGGGMVPVRNNNYMRPGELTSGGYGFYHNPRQMPSPPPQSVFDQLGQIKVEDLPQRSKDPAIPYSQMWSKSLVTNPFTNVKWKECLESHGILIDTDKKTLTIQSEATKYDRTYQLSDEEYRDLMSNRIDKVSLQKRVDIINKAISSDYSEPITLTMLDSTERIKIPLKESVSNDLALREQAAMRQQQVESIADPLSQGGQNEERLNRGTASVHGADLQELNEAKGWFLEGSHGREVSVGEIWVEPVKDTKPDQLVCKTADGKYIPVDLSFNDMQSLDRNIISKEQLFEKLTGRTLAEGEGVQRIPAGQVTKDENGDYRFNKNPVKTTVKYQMSAVINGETVTHEISEKEFNKFVTQDDYHRMKLFSKTFGEVDMKTLPGMRVNFMQGFEMALGAIHGLANAAGDVAYGIGAVRASLRNPHHEDFGHGHSRSGMFIKPDVDSPQEIAERAFAVGMREGEMNEQMRGRGI